MNNEFPPTEIEAPWGKYDISSHLGFIKQLIDQLRHYLDTNVTPNQDHTRRDIAGYEAVLVLGSEETAGNFFNVKSEARELGHPFADNLEVVTHLHANGLWKAVNA